MSLNYPHPDLMLQELTPEQASELFMYASIEPFGEIRSDLRAARLMHLYYETKRGKKGKEVSVGEFVMYQDYAEASREHRVRDSLADALDGMAARTKRG